MTAMRDHRLSLNEKSRVISPGLSQNVPLRYLKVWDFEIGPNISYGVEKSFVARFVAVKRINLKTEC
jgi:hypothetical protein